MDTTLSSKEDKVSYVEDNRARWILLTAIAPIAWGTTYFVTRHFLPADAPLWAAVIRCLPAGLLVLLFARKLPTGSWWWRSVVLGVLNVGGFSVLVYIVGLRLPTSLGSILMSASAAFLMLFAWLLLRQRPTLAAALGALIGIAGVAVMLGSGAGQADFWGVAASIGAMVASSIGFVLTVRWGGNVPVLAMTSWQLIAGSLVVVPFALLVEGAPPALDPTAMWAFAYIVVVATALAYAVWFNGLRRLPAAVVGVIGLLNPLTGVLMGVLLAGEEFGPPQMIGVALVIIGVLIGTKRVKSREQVPVST